jgi:uncharacterized membrane protein SpoIIM required for sporulation
MKVSEILEQRQSQWARLEELGKKLRTRLGRRSAEDISLFGKLYRDACADLALADAYQLPPETVEYLHRLVARSHNLLYRSRGFDYRAWAQTLFVTVPRTIFRDSCVHLAFLLFWSLFLISAFTSYQDAEFAAKIVGSETLGQAEDSFALWEDRTFGVNFNMACFYIWNNAGIGLQCFAFSILFVPGLFELTAIVLSAGAGLRIGLGLVRTRGLGRLSSIAKSGREALPIAACAVILFILAAMIEGFVSPSNLPWAAKGLVALITSTMLLVYFVVLGFPRGGADET